MDWSSMVTVGRVIRPHGNRGHVLVWSETDFGEDRFAVGSVLHHERDGRIEPLTVAATRFHDGRWFVGFAGIESINDAETLRGHDLRIPGEAVMPLPPGQFYVFDLVGCEMRTIAGRRVGVIERVDLTTGVPVLVVMDGGEEILVPFNEAICRRVMPADRFVEIDPPEGLIELNKRGAR